MLFLRQRAGLRGSMMMDRIADFWWTATILFHLSGSAHHVQFGRIWNMYKYMYINMLACWPKFHGSIFGIQRTGWRESWEETISFHHWILRFLVQTTFNFLYNNSVTFSTCTASWMIWTKKHERPVDLMQGIWGVRRPRMKRVKK